MKKFSFTIILIFVFAGFLQSQWFRQNVNLDTVSFIDVWFVNVNTGFVVGEGSNNSGYLLKTTDGGTNWITQISGSVPGLWSINFVDQNTGWAAGNKGIILKTTNTGLNWVSQLSDTAIDFEVVYFINSNTGWASGSNLSGYDLYKTTNGGSNWLIIRSYNTFFDVYFINEMTGWGSAYWSTIFKTTNGGLNWSQAGPSGDQARISRVFFFNKDTGYCAGQGSSKQISKTTNGGTNWTRIINQDNPGFEWITFRNINTGWAVGYQIYKTTNQGVNWIHQPVSDTGFVALMSVSFADDNTGWAVGSYHLILKTVNGGVSVNQIGSIVPEKYLLKQNYPNPFNPDTKIEFDISERKSGGTIKLKVFDLTGKEITTLVDGKLSPGSYSIPFNGSLIPSGVYFYRLEAGDYIQTKKMVLLK